MSKRKYTPGKLLLVGNGGSLLKRRLGLFIDEFDGKIVRFNDFETIGFEQYVGTRIDIWVCHEGWDWADVAERIGKQPLHIPKEFKKQLRKQFRRAVPSTGISAIAYFLEQGFDVTIIGFDHFQDEMIHYFNICTKGDHSGIQEKKFAERLQKEGKIKVFKEFSDPEITIIIPFYDEGAEPAKTIQSIIDNTPGNSFKIILIDDCSTKYRDGQFDEFKHIRYIRNRQRMGVDYCRTLGGYVADTKYLMFIDAHMRFFPGWLDRYIYALEKDPESIVYCKSDWVTDYPDNENIVKPGERQMYFADLKLQRNGEILSSKWKYKEPEKIFTEATGMMGACYGITKQWFKHIRGFEGLRRYGMSEQYIALKNLYLGGKIIFCKDVRIAHLYKHIATHVPGKEYYYYNQMFTLRSLLPWGEVNRLEKLIPEGKYKELAQAMIKKNHRAVMLLRKDLNKKKKISYNDLVKKYDL